MSVLAEFESAPDYLGNDQWDWRSYTILNLTQVAWASPAMTGGTSVKLIGDGSSTHIRVPYEDFKAMWRKAMGLT